MVNRIARPLSFQTIRKKLLSSINSLKSNAYKSINEFSLDARTVFANFFRYNYRAESLKLRKDVSRVLFQFETSWLNIVQSNLQNQSSSSSSSGIHDAHSLRQPIPELKACLMAFDDIVKLPQSGSTGRLQSMAPICFVLDVYTVCL